MNKININNHNINNNMLQMWNNNQIIVNKKKLYALEFNRQSGEQGHRISNADKLQATFWELQFEVYKTQIKIIWCGIL